MTRPFLTARWENLALLNYPVEASVLEPHLPEGCVLDSYEGQAWLSIVAFRFRDTRVFGLRWPGLSDFPEINLRFYIRHRGRRGVCFIREFVPSRLIAGVARQIYNEPYCRARMSEETELKDGGRSIAHLLSVGRESLEL